MRTETDQQKVAGIRAEEFEALKRVLFMRILDDGARRRLNNIRTANPEFAMKVEAALMQVMQSQGPKKIDEETLIKIIRQLRPKRRETTIRRI